MAYNPYGGYQQPIEYTPDLQQRLEMMQRASYLNKNNYNQYPYQQVPQNNIITIPVTCFEEAKAARIALDGSITVFLDIQNNCVYTKKLNNNGVAELIIYKRVNENTPVATIAPVEQSNTQFVSLEDFNILKNKFELLEQKYESIGGKSNVSKSNATNQSTHK